MANLTVLARFTTDKAPKTGLTLSEVQFRLTAIAKADGAQTSIWTAQPATIEYAGHGEYGAVYAEADFTTYDYLATCHYVGAEAVDNAYAGGVISADPLALSAADVWSVGTRTLTSFGSLASDMVTALLATTIFGRSIQNLWLDTWAQVVGNFAADDADEPATITYKAPDDSTTQLTHTLTDTTRTRS